MKDQYILNKSFKIIKKIGNGAFGNVYKGIHLATDNFVAIKVETVDSKKTRLENEYIIYNKIQGIGIPKVYHYDKTERMLILDYLGPSLENLFDFCNRKFSHKTICLLGIQLLERVEHVHQHGFIHRDIKPDNFLIGIGKNKSKIFLVDFGLSKLFKANEDHIGYKNNKNFTGTYRYSSLRNHKGIEQSRRDDLESIGYMLIYFSSGRLPWQGIRNSDKSKRNLAIYTKKRNTPLNELCESCPKCMIDYMKYCRLLRFRQHPDYERLKNFFKQQLIQDNKKIDYIFDWNILANQKTASK